jgi:hypothetical protein
MLLWSSTEVLMTIICACIPVLRPLYVRIAYGSRGDSSYPSSGNKKSSSMAYELGPSAGHSMLKSNASHSEHREEDVYVGHRRGDSTSHVKAGVRERNTSEESILREEQGANGGFEGWGEIKRTDEIVVVSSKASQPDLGNSRHSPV